MKVLYLDGNSLGKRFKKSLKQMPLVCDMQQFKLLEGNKRIYWLESPESQRNILEEKEEFRARKEHTVFRVYKLQGQQPSILSRLKEDPAGKAFLKKTYKGPTDT